MPDINRRFIPGSFSTRLTVLSAIVLLILMYTACSVPAKSSGTTSAASDADGSSVWADSPAGNMHYQNLVLLVSERIYFTSSDGKLCSANTDGSNTRIMYEQTSSNLTSDGGFLYYTDNLQTGNLNKIKTDGTNQVRIGNTPLKYLITAGSSLYAIESAGGQVISLRPDGTGRTLLADCQAVALLETGKQLYICGTANNTGLIRMDLQSGVQETLIQTRISSPNLQDGWLYFADPANEYKLQAWSVNDKKSWQICQLHLEKPFIVNGGYLFFIDSSLQNRLYRLPVDGRQNLDRLTPQLIVDDAIGAFSVCGNYIYYQRPDSRRIYRIPADGGKPLRIT